MSELEVGSSYWIDFEHPTRGICKLPLSVVDVDGELMGSDAYGRPGKLPQNIVNVHKMNEFQRLQWRSRVHQRDGHVEIAKSLEALSYTAMPDGFYRVRLERIATGMGDVYLRVEIEKLRKYRPDLQIDDLPCMQKEAQRELERAEMKAALTLTLTQLDALDEPKLQLKKPSLRERVCNFFGRSPQ